jgi:hypothetical protein
MALGDTTRSRTYAAGCVPSAFRSRSKTRHRTCPRLCATPSGRSRTGTRRALAPRSAANPGPDRCGKGREVLPGREGQAAQPVRGGRGPPRLDVVGGTATSGHCASAPGGGAPRGCRSSFRDGHTAVYRPNRFLLGVARSACRRGSPRERQLTSALYSMIRLLQPTRSIEVGSRHSSLVAKLAISANVADDSTIGAITAASNCPPSAGPNRWHA